MNRYEFLVREWKTVRFVKKKKKIGKKFVIKRKVLLDFDIRFLNEKKGDSAIAKCKNNFSYERYSVHQKVVYKSRIPLVKLCVGFNVTLIWFECK